MSATVSDFEIDFKINQVFTSIIFLRPWFCRPTVVESKQFTLHLKHSQLPRPNFLIRLISGKMLYREI